VRCFPLAIQHEIALGKHHPIDPNPIDVMKRCPFFNRYAICDIPQVRPDDEPTKISVVRE